MKKIDVDNLINAGEMLWVVLANVSGGDWSQQSEEWQGYAARWRDNFHDVVRDIQEKYPEYEIENVS